MFSSPKQTMQALASVGYIVDDVTATVVHLAKRLNRPVLLEGPPGSGKTELAYAVAKATSTEVERLQCFEGINEDNAIGRFDESLQRLAVEMRAKSGQVEWEPLKQELHSLDFFAAGPLLRALQSPNPCVVLIDEIDKVNPEFEAFVFGFRVIMLLCAGLSVMSAGVGSRVIGSRRPAPVPRMRARTL